MQALLPLHIWLAAVNKARVPCTYSFAGLCAQHLRCACWPYQVRLQTDSRHTLSMACMGMQSRTCKAGM